MSKGKSYLIVLSPKFRPRALTSPPVSQVWTDHGAEEGGVPVLRRPRRAYGDGGLADLLRGRGEPDAPLRAHRQIECSIPVPQERETEAKKPQILYGMDLGAPSAEEDEGAEGEKQPEAGVRSVPLGSRVFYTADEVRSFRTVGLEPGASSESDGPGIQFTAWSRNQAAGFQTPEGPCLRRQHQALDVHLSR